MDTSKMDRTQLIVQFLTEWQMDYHDDVETASDIKIFNTIGTIVTLVNGGLLNIIKVHEFMETLNLSDEERAKAYRTYAYAYELAIKERYKNG